MAYPLEQIQEFHFVRRILRIVAPEYRLFATGNLKADECVLDLKRLTIEIGEGTQTLLAVGAVLFQIGHLRLSKGKGLGLDEHFGKFQDQDEGELIAKLISQGKRADKAAAKWAVKLMTNNWNVEERDAQRYVGAYVWSDLEWADYYASS